ncbi:hypothetical protein ACFL54_06235 [Planctomycetota bacterium]
MCDQNIECKNPEELKEKPGKCTTEQKKKCHGPGHNRGKEDDLLGDAEIEQRYWFKPRTWMGFG